MPSTITIRRLLQADLGHVCEFFFRINFPECRLNFAPHPFTDKEAQAIMKYREQNGSLKNFEQLTKVPGLDVEKLQAKRSRIAFSL